MLEKYFDIDKLNANIVQAMLDFEPELHDMDESYGVVIEELASDRLGQYQSGMLVETLKLEEQAKEYLEEKNDDYNLYNPDIWQFLLDDFFYKLSEEIEAPEGFNIGFNHCEHSGSFNLILYKSA